MSPKPSDCRHTGFTNKPIGEGLEAVFWSHGVPEAGIFQTGLVHSRSFLPLVQKSQPTQERVSSTGCMAEAKQGRPCISSGMQSWDSVKDLRGSVTTETCEEKPLPAIAGACWISP